MTTRLQQILLLLFILIGSLLIGIWTYRAPPAPAPAPREAAQAMQQDFAESETEAAPTPPTPLPVSEKKARFFSRLTPLIARENSRTLQARASLLRMKNQLQLEEPLTEEQQRLVKQLAKKYRLGGDLTDPSMVIHQLLTRVDLVPTSLALAQAASESAWGNSRFARQANNLFGQWCFSAGCGLVPLQRPQGMTHEVARYPSWQASVRAYLLNLNSHPAYQPLRDIRLDRRQQNLPLSGELLAEGLEKYSARGAIYVESLQQIIRVNGLDRLDGI